MKKTLITLSLVALIGFTAQAQKARIGLKGGLNFANVDTAGDPDGRTGFHIGAYGEFGAGGFAIQPEFLFSAKGSDDVNLSYVEVPILLKKSFAKVLNIHVGPQFGFLMSAVDSEDDDVKDFVKSSDLSAVFGGGVDLPGGLNAGARYVLGLSDIDDTGFAEVKNKTFQVYVGYKLFGK